MKGTSVSLFSLSALFSSIYAYSWTYTATPKLAAIISVVTAGTCAAAPPACIQAGLVGIFLLVLGSVSGSPSGQGGSPLPITNGKRGSSRQFWHDHGNGNMSSYLDTSVLKQGIIHHLWDSEGFHYTATRHSKTNDPVLQVFLGGNSTVTRRAPRGKRDTDEIDSFATSWVETGSARDNYTDQDASNDASIARTALFTDPDTCTELAAEYICSTLNPDPDAETFAISISPQGPGFSTEIEPACKA